MTAFAHAWRALTRDLRAGELRVLAAALVIATAAVSSVGFFTDRMRAAMQDQAAELLAADLALTSTDPIPEQWRSQARALGLALSGFATFPSVLAGSDGVQLIEVKAVEPGYPLRGTVRLAPAPLAPTTVARDVPPPGVVWLDAAILARFGWRVGDGIAVGAQRFRVGAVLVEEPDRGFEVFAVAPRVLMNAADLPATRLISPGSRVHYRLLLAGATEALSRYRERVLAERSRGIQLLDVRNARPEVRTALERADRFLGLAALIAVLLAGTATAMAARRYSARHVDGAALMRCFGASQRFIVQLHLIQLLLIGFAASAAGVALGFVAQQGLALLLSGLLPRGLPLPGPWPAVTGFATGVIVLLGFAVPEVVRLKRVPPARVLRHDLGPLPLPAALLYGAALAALILLVAWQTADLPLALYVLAGAGASLALLALIAVLLVRLLAPLRRGAAGALRLGLAAVARRARGSVVQVVAFGLGLMVILLLSIVRADLLAAWVRSLPPDAPNQFLINIEPAQLPELRRFVAQRGLAETEFYPMVRGRLVAINEVAVRPEQYADERTRHLVTREFNLSYARTLRADNRILAGSFWPERAEAEPVVSLEQGMAQRLGLKLGDRLSWRVNDREVVTTITSLRRVSWDSFRPNFFVLAPPGVFDRYPATWMTAFHLPPTDSATLPALARGFPNVTVIDIGTVMERVRQVMERAQLAVQYVFLFTLAAGLAVLYAAIAATRDERRHEAALLRVLGATHALVLKTQAAEFVVLGTVAGTLAALAASLTSLVLAQFVFDLPYAFNPWVWVIGTVAGGLGVGIAGVLGTRSSLYRPPAEVLRD